MQFEERIIAGSPADFMEARHLLLRGSNREIGAKLAEIALERHQGHKMFEVDPLLAQAQYQYVQRNYPILLERMRGVADAFGADPASTSLYLAMLPYYLGLPACSAVYYPPATTTVGHGVVSRNYDFTTGTMFGQTPAEGEMAATSRPYVIEVYPDEGYPSLYLCSYDLLSGALDGVNSEGLTVAILAADELYNDYPMESTGRPGVGLYELHMPRLLLDTCATVEEAKRCLLLNKQYYMVLSLHYLIADRYGNSFVWETSHAHNGEYILDGRNAPQIVTNFMLYRYPTASDIPQGDDSDRYWMYSRYLSLLRAIESAPPPYSLDFIREANARVFFDHLDKRSTTPERTLWHSIYDVDDRSLRVSFYLRDEPDPEHPGQTRAVRSGYHDLRLAAR